MANRYDKWANTNYVQLPVDAYQQALSVPETRGLAQLEKSKQVRDYFDNVQAIYEPDRALKAYHQQELQNQIADIASKKLNAKETISEIQRIVNDRTRINDFAAIAENTDNYNKYMTNRAEYKKKYGNEYNYLNQDLNINEYNKLGQNKGAFRTGVLRDNAIDDYVDIVGDMQKVLEKQKERGREFERTDGRYIYFKGEKGVPIEELLKDAGIMINDPKYQNQLQHLNRYYAYQSGDRDIKKGYQIQAKNYGETQLADMQSQLDEYKKSKGAKADKIKQAEQELRLMKGKLDLLDEQQASSLSMQSLMNRLSNQAAAPFDYMTQSEKLRPDAYGLIEERGKWDWDLFRRKQEFKKKLEEGEQVPMMSMIDMADQTDEAAQKMREMFPGLQLNDSSSDFREDPSNITMLKEFFNPFGTWNPNSIKDQFTNDFQSSWKQLSNYAKENDPYYEQQFGTRVPDPKNQTDRAYMLKMYNNVKSATQSELQHTRYYPLSAVFGKDEQKAKELVYNIINTNDLKMEGSLRNTWNDLVKDEDLIKDMPELKDFNKFKKAFVDNSAISVNQDGNFKLDMLMRDGTKRTVNVTAPKMMRDYFQSQKNIYDPSSGYGEGTIMYYGKPVNVVSKRWIDNGQFVKNIFEPIATADPRFTDNMNGKTFNGTSVYKTIENTLKAPASVMGNIARYVDGMRKGDVITINTTTGQKASPNDPVEGLISISKNGNNQVTIVRKSDRSSEDLGDGAVNSFFMIGPGQGFNKKLNLPNEGLTNTFFNSEGSSDENE